MAADVGAQAVPAVRQRPADPHGRRVLRITADPGPVPAAQSSTEAGAERKPLAVTVGFDTMTETSGSPAILGMPLDVPGDDLIATAQPLCGMVIVKALDPGGEVVYLTAATPGLKSVECLGMVRYAALKLEHAITAGLGEEA